LVPRIIGGMVNTRRECCCPVAIAAGVLVAQQAAKPGASAGTDQSAPAVRPRILALSIVDYCPKSTRRLSISCRNEYPVVTRRNARGNRIQESLATLAATLDTLNVRVASR
jgi:hypothetical protein